MSSRRRITSRTGPGIIAAAQAKKIADEKESREMAANAALNSSASSETAKQALLMATPLPNEDGGIQARFRELAARRSKINTPSERRKIADPGIIKARRRSRIASDALSASSRSKRIQALIRAAKNASSSSVDVLTIVVTKTARGKVFAFGSPTMQTMWNQLPVQEMFRRTYTGARYSAPVFPYSEIHNDRNMVVSDRQKMPAPRMPSAQSKPKSGVVASETTTSASESSEGPGNAAKLPMDVGYADLDY